MKVLKISGPAPGNSAGTAEVLMSSDELLMMTNALNEVCNALEMPEFATRIGADRSEVLRLLRELGDLCDKVAGQRTTSGG